MPAPRREPPSKKVAGSDAKALAWLLTPDEPAIQYRALTELVGLPESAPEVLRSRSAILRTGWAADILARRRPGSGWEDGPRQYQPKYLSTNWMMLVLSDLGLTKTDPEIADLCERWMDGFAAKDGGLGGNSAGTPHYCVAANLARGLIKFGYAHDSRVRRTLERLVHEADPKGGWSCFGRGRNLDSWEALSAFAVYPRSLWTGEMRTCVELAAEFFLERELHRQGSHYAPWYRFHYPIHYYYDLLVGLDFMTALGYAAEPRLDYALGVLRSRRRPDGRWNLDAVHPDVGSGMARWYERHPTKRPVPFSLEPVGRPSKMITLTALEVLARVGTARPVSPAVAAAG